MGTACLSMRPTHTAGSCQGEWLSRWFLAHDLLSNLIKASLAPYSGFYESYYPGHFRSREDPAKSSLWLRNTKLKAAMEQRLVFLKGRRFTFALVFLGALLLLGQCLFLDNMKPSRMEPTAPLPKRPMIPVKRKDYSTLTWESLNLEYSNSPALFNAIHSSMRQFGSALNHNGITLFPATVPAGTVFFHGRNDAAMPSSPEWLGFEMEQANVFARTSRPDDRSGGPPQRHKARAETGTLVVQESQSVTDESTATTGGFMHTFRTTRELRLLYLDGISAGKSGLGTMDLTNVIIDWSFSNHGSDNERAEALCKWNRDQGYRLDGFIRTEQNFEVIFCDFSSDALQLVDTVQKQTPPEDSGDIDDRTWTSWEFARAAERRYNGIGSSRVVLDYAGTTSFYGTPASEWFDYSDGLPRLTNLTQSDTDAFFVELKQVMTRDPSWSMESRNWRDVADLVVSLYATKLRTLERYASQGTGERFTATLSHMLVPFLDYRKPREQRRAEALSSCTYEYLPQFLSTPQENKLFTAFENVTSTVCVVLVSLHESDISLPRKQEVVEKLMNYLRWSQWKECTGCQFDELCIVPMWPFGGPGDRIHPNCVSVDVFRSDAHRGYWGGER